METNPSKGCNCLLSLSIVHFQALNYMLKNMKNHNTIGYKANCENITYIHISYQQKTEDFSINYA